ncbi:MAG: decaprenyl-phosphate phosphoribosyltransferase [Alphaproteobacteria bacterium]
MSQPSSLAALLWLLRPHQWVKNGFVLAPLAFTPSAVNLATVGAALAAVACFSAMASAIYVLNDFVDREADRAHPTKRKRPLAAGTVAVPAALATMAALVVAGLAGAWWLDPAFAVLLAVYATINVAYSLYLKRIAIVDVVIIALGFVLRVEGGAAVVDVDPSSWIVIMTGLVALFLALAKRRDDLAKQLGQGHRASLDGYTKPFLDAAISVILGALLVAYLIYTTDATVMARLGTDKLFYTAPFVVIGVLRYLQLTMVMEVSGSPTRVVLSDRFLILTIAGWVAAFAALLYLPWP